MFSPCGMRWTKLRACYGFTMKVFIGGVETEYPARWFFCDPDALPFPFPHGCEASPWLQWLEVNKEWGEIAGAKLLDRGINRGYLGQSFVGQAQWFLDGQLPANVIPPGPPVPTPSCGPLPPVNYDPRCRPVPVTCFPYYDLTQVTATHFSFSQGSGDFGSDPFPFGYWVHFSLPAFGADLTIYRDKVPVSPELCVDSPFATRLMGIFVMGGIEYPQSFFQFVSYNPLTHSGYWQFAANAPLFAGELAYVSYTLP